MAKVHLANQHFSGNHHSYQSIYAAGLFPIPATIPSGAVLSFAVYFYDGLE